MRRLKLMASELPAPGHRLFSISEYEDRVGLLFRLFMLVAVALLPAIAIQSYNEFALRRSREAEVQEQALSLSRIAAAEIQQSVEGVRDVLIALSELPAIKARNTEACNAYLSAIKRRYPAFLSFLVVDMNGQSLCAVDGRKTNVAGRAYFANAIKTGQLSIGEFSIGRMTGRHVLQFALPFYGDESAMAGVIVAPLDLEWLATFVAQLGVPTGAALGITDRNGTYLARSPDNGAFVGRKMPNDLYAQLRKPGTIAARDLDGMERIIGSSPVMADSGGLLVTVGLDRMRAFAGIERRTELGIVLILLSTSLVLLLTWFGARRFIDEPLGRLVDGANQLRLGDYARRVKIPDTQPEIARVADAFNSMADVLQERERELCQAKERAEEAAARITTLFESTIDCVLIVDRNWRITYLNERARVQLVGRRDVVGADFWETFNEVVDFDLTDLFRKAMLGQRQTCFEAFCTPSGVWYEINAFPSGEGLALLLRDISEHRSAVEARRQMEEQLHQSQKMEAVGQLTGGVAHDFNNLLMIVAGNLEMIEEQAADPDCVRRLAAVARKAADRGTAVTSQLLVFSRRQELNPRPVYADHLIRDFDELIRRALGDRCELRISADERLWPCHVDPGQLQTALLNLAVNGRDAMPDGGVLAIEARNVTVDEHAIGVEAGSYVRISLTDTGSGMTSDVLDRAFEPFFTTKDVGRGTGLGLSMVYGFVRQSGGHITIKSAPGNGTTVSLYLPRSSQVLDANGPMVRAQKASTDSGRVLLVEDDDDVLDVTSSMLGRLGYQVVCARSGIEAIRMLKSDKEFDLLFTDVLMPQGVNGIELAREARKICNGIKVLLASGNATDVLARHGAVDEFPIIGKPFRRSELAQHLQVVMGDA